LPLAADPGPKVMGHTAAGGVAVVKWYMGWADLSASVGAACGTMMGGPWEVAAAVLAGQVWLPATSLGWGTVGGAGGGMADPFLGHLCMPRGAAWGKPAAARRSR